jgi:hypothetical protein
MDRLADLEILEEIAVAGLGHGPTGIDERTHKGLRKMCARAAPPSVAQGDGGGNGSACCNHGARKSGLDSVNRCV